MADEATSPLTTGLPYWRKAGFGFLMEPTASVDPPAGGCGAGPIRGEGIRALKSDSTSIPTLRDVMQESEDFISPWPSGILFDFG